MLTFDFETTGLDFGSALNKRNRVLMVAWQVDDGPIKRYVGDLLDAKEFWDAVHAADVLCAYNAKFEQLWFLRYGMVIENWQWHDPMLAEKVLRGNLTRPLDLGSVAEQYGYTTKDPMIDSMMKGGICPSEMPQKRLLARCVRDVRTTSAIMSVQLKELQRRDALHIYRLRANFCGFLAQVEAEGMLLDRDRVAAEYGKVAAALTDVSRKLDELTGGINMRSPDQLAHYQYVTLKVPERKDARGRPLRNKPSKQFPDGRPKTDKDTLTLLARGELTSEQRNFVSLRQEYGKLNAALTKNLEFFYGVCQEYGGTFKARFNQTVAKTHRLTSSGSPLQFDIFPKPKSVQFQNMPRDYKRMFTAPEGYVIVECDSAQLEFRVAAFLGQDKQAMLDIGDPDFDAHCKSAAVMNGIPYDSFMASYLTGDKAYKRMRTEAKPDTFKPLYGGGRGTPEQEKWYKEFNKRYSGVYAEQENWLADVARDGKLCLPWGMTFFWPKTQMNRRGVLLDSDTFRPVRPQVFNYPVQSLATAEIVPIAILALARHCKARNIDVKFVNTVHDSVIAYVNEEHLAGYVWACERAFTTDVYEYLRDHYGIEFNVPLGCEIVAGRHWGEGTEHVYDDVNNWKEREDG